MLDRLHNQTRILARKTLPMPGMVNDSQREACRARFRGIPFPSQKLGPVQKQDSFLLLWLQADVS
jgi:hypothetical protein